MAELEPCYISGLESITDKYVELVRRIETPYEQAYLDVVAVASKFLSHEKNKLPTFDLEVVTDTEKRISLWEEALMSANSGRLETITGLIMEEGLYFLEKVKRDGKAEEVTKDLNLANGIFGLIGRLYDLS
jgi:hypothetical protein